MAIDWYKVKVNKALQESRRKAFILSFKEECALCGYSKCKEALCFHHIKQDEKEREIKPKLTYKQIETEIKKCVVLCANCHMELHAGLHDGLFEPTLEEYEEQPEQLGLFL